MSETLEYKIFRIKDTKDCYAYQHINHWSYPFGEKKGEIMKTVDTDYLVEQYKLGKFDDHPWYKYNPSFRKYIFYRYREKYIANKSRKKEKKEKPKSKNKEYSMLYPHIELKKKGIKFN